MKTHLLFWAVMFMNPFLYTASAQTETVTQVLSYTVYKGKLPEGIHTVTQARQDIIDLLNKKHTVYSTYAGDFPGIFYYYPTNKKSSIINAVSSDSGVIITIKGKTYKLTVAEPTSPSFSVTGWNTCKGIFMIRDFSVGNGKWVTLYSKDKAAMCRLADDFYFMRKEILSAEWQRFSNLVAENKSPAKNKVVSEEQRKYIVQANAATSVKNYDEAISFFKDALKISETSYPNAYYNLALLYAEKKVFDLAILNMKKYLLLSPQASDARAAKDKIYEWEAGINE